MMTLQGFVHLTAPSKFKGHSIAICGTEQTWFHMSHCLRIERNPRTTDPTPQKYSTAVRSCMFSPEENGSCSARVHTSGTQLQTQHRSLTTFSRSRSWPIQSRRWVLRLVTGCWPVCSYWCIFDMNNLGEHIIYFRFIWDPNLWGLHWMNSNNQLKLHFWSVWWESQCFMCRYSFK